MTLQEALDKILPSYARYYDINKDNPAVPFAAEGEFRSHSEKFVLVKAAKIADIDSNEFMYFALQESLDSFLLGELSSIAWEKGLSKVQPYNGHKNSDVTLIVIAGKTEGDIKKASRKLKMSKNYMFGFYGYSNFRLCVLDLEKGVAFSNFHGRDIKNLLYKLGLSSCK